MSFFAPDVNETNKYVGAIADVYVPFISTIPFTAVQFFCSLLSVLLPLPFHILSVKPELGLPVTTSTDAVYGKATVVAAVVEE